MTYKKIKQCGKCGETVEVQGYFMGPLYTHEENDGTCFRNQLRNKDKEIDKLKDELERLKENVMFGREFLSSEIKHNKVLRNKILFVKDVITYYQETWLNGKEADELLNSLKRL